MTRSSSSRWPRRVLVAVLVAAAVLLLFTFVFPAVTSRLQDPTLGAPPTKAAPH